MSGLREISQIILGVSDQERSLEFYEQKLGLEKRSDEQFGDGQRWIVLYCPVGSTGIALAPPSPGTEPTVRVFTGIAFQTEDIDATHAELKQNGVDVDAEIMRMPAPVPDMFWLRDPDSNVLLVVQAPA